MTHSYIAMYLVALMKPSRWYGGNELFWDKLFPCRMEMVNMSTSTCFCNTCRELNP